MATWITCNFCDEWWCNLHQAHVHDCDCPPLEDLLPVDPYEDSPEMVAGAIKKTRQSDGSRE